MCLWYQLSRQLNLRLGEINTDNLESPAQLLRHRHTRATTGIENTRALGQP